MIHSAWQMINEILEEHDAVQVDEVTPAGEEQQAGNRVELAEVV